MSPLRPSDDDATKAVLRRLKADTGLPVVIAGECEGDRAVLRHLIGMKTRAMHDLNVATGTGLGGRVLATGRPTMVDDYARSASITQDYAHLVSKEGLRGMTAVPVVVNGTPRAVLYGAARVTTRMGDRVQTQMMAAAARLRQEIAVRDEVDRRVRLAGIAAAERSHGLDTRDREQLRLIHGELRAIAGLIGDTDLRARLQTAVENLAGVGHTTEPVACTGFLAPRELDVLAQVAIGCSNAEVAARLSLSAETVKSYLRSIGTKLGTSTRMEAVARARLLGMLP